MAIQSTVCASYKQEIFSGIHDAADRYRIALYNADANLGPDTKVYTPINEVRGPGYEPGGQTLTGFRSGIDNRVAWLDWKNGPSWYNATIVARAAMIYNYSKGNRSVAVLDFGSNKTSTNGTFEIVFPKPTANEALIRID